MRYKYLALPKFLVFVIVQFLFIIPMHMLFYISVHRDIGRIKSMLHGLVAGFREMNQSISHIRFPNLEFCILIFVFVVNFKKFSISEPL